MFSHSIPFYFTVVLCSIILLQSIILFCSILLFFSSIILLFYTIISFYPSLLFYSIRLFEHTLSNFIILFDAVTEVVHISNRSVMSTTQLPCQIANLSCTLIVDVAYVFYRNIFPCLLTSYRIMSHHIVSYHIRFSWSVPENEKSFKNKFFLIAQLQVQKLVILRELQKRSLSMNAVYSPMEKRVEAEGIILSESMINQKSVLELQSKIHKINQNIERFQTSFVSDSGMAGGTVEEASGKITKIDSRGERENDRPLGILHDRMGEVLAIRTNHTIIMSKLMKFKTRTPNAATVPSNSGQDKNGATNVAVEEREDEEEEKGVGKEIVGFRTKEKEFPMIKSNENRQRDLSPLGLLEESEKRAEEGDERNRKRKNKKFIKRDEVKEKSFFSSFDSRKSRRRANSRKAIDADVHLIVVVDNKSKSHCLLSNISEYDMICYALL